MAQDNKKYYWIKLKTDFFNQETIDFLLSQQNGCEYIVLYQMLCLNTANTNGAMISKIGEIIVPYDINKIVRDTKYFDNDTVVVALELFKKLGLIYEEKDKLLRIANFDEMIGSETVWAEKKRIYREKQKLLNYEDNVEDNVREENRDKSIDNRYKNIKEEQEEERQTIFDFIESEFGRTLSPTEYEYISNWEDNDLTRYAIKVAILNNAPRIKYIQGILDNYKSKNIKTVQEAQEDEKKFKRKGVPEWLDKEYVEEVNEEAEEFERKIREYHKQQEKS